MTGRNARFRGLHIGAEAFSFVRAPPFGFNRHSHVPSFPFFRYIFLPMRIPDYLIDEVRTANDIVEIVSAFVQLKRRGKNFTGLCPFHQEKTPSFTVSQDKQMFHCFGCGKGGNVFTFVMDIEKVSFVEAVRSLAERAGISLPTESSPSEQPSESENLYAACRFAGLHFYKNLTESPEGKSALRYFHDRGFTDDTVRNFGLGYSKNSWDDLLVAAQLKGIPVDHLVKAGLVRSRDEGGGHYDYFRGRAMFPIFSTSGRVIAFGARKLREDDSIQGKYINSPETTIYSKSRVVFGLFQSRDAIRLENNALMVEGYADAISLFQAGIQNVVSSSGTALTADQVGLVSKYARTMTIVYDADSAGSQATLRGVDVALEHGLDVKIVPLPKGEDPDSFVRKHGAKEFRELLPQAVSFIDFKAAQFMNQGAFATPEGKTEAVRSIVQSVAKIADELKRNFFLKEVADRYGIYESVLHRELERWISKEARNRRPPGPDWMPSRKARPSQGTGLHKEIPSAERDILKILFENDADAVALVASNLSLDELTDPRVRTLAERALESWRHEGGIQITSFVNELTSDELKSILTDVTLSKYELSAGWKDREPDVDEPQVSHIARAAINAIKRAALRKQIEENQVQLRDASRDGKETMPFVLRHQELLQSIKDLETPKTN